MRYLDIENWNRKQHFEHFSRLKDPYFAVVVDVDVTQVYQYSKERNISFFSLYLHACMKAINAVENLRYRIEGDQVVIYDVIHASVTIPRKDTTFGFSFVHYSENFETFNDNLEKEKEIVYKMFCMVTQRLFLQEFPKLKSLSQNEHLQHENGFIKN